MMKHAMLALATALLALSGAGRSVAQEWFPQGAEWYYGSWGANYLRAQVVGEEMLDGKLTKQIQITYDDGTIETQNVYEENNRVWKWHVGAFRLSIDMNLGVGDTLSFQYYEPIGYYDVVTVDSISTWTVGPTGLALKVLHLSAESPECRFTHVEKIGTIHDFLQLPYCTTVPTIEHFRCYSDAEISFQYVSYPCDTAFHTAIEGEPSLANLKLRVYPNPTQGRFALELPAGQTHAALAIFDALGAKVLETSYREGQEINIECFPNGLYFAIAVIDAGKHMDCVIIKR